MQENYSGDKLQSWLKEQAADRDRKFRQVQSFINNTELRDCRLCSKKPRMLVQGDSVGWKCTAGCSICSLVSRGKDGDRAKERSIKDWNLIHGL